MPLFAGCAATGSAEARYVRERLSALRDDPTAHPDREVDGERLPVTWAGSEGTSPSPGEPGEPFSGSRAARLVRRWVPASLLEARWEPGRPGALLLSVVTALAAMVAAVGVWRHRPVAEPVPMLPLVSTAAAPVSAAPPPLGAAREVVVSVLGRVVRPGLVRLPEGSRVSDALNATGGALPGTDLMGLNLARRLSDGEQIVVGAPPPAGQPPQAAPGASMSPPEPVDLNSATLEQLDALPGVGPVTAKRILDWRAAHGPFTSVDQLRHVSGVGPARLAQLRGLVRV
jgi:competence protein ComEA